MKQGDVVGENECVTDYYRRLISFGEFCDRLADLGFAINMRVAKRGLAKLGDDDPTVGRIVTRKSG
ncbi:MAG: hypothetical protein AAF718_10925 [Pseudomonadota bacterium]